MNGKTHKIIGATVCGGYALAEELKLAEKEDREINWLKILGYGAGGWFLGRLPDMIEPATSPNHRQFFHSVVFALGGYCAVKKLKEKTDSPLLKHFLTVLLLSYGSHLAADAITPKSLPLIHTKIA